MGIYIFVFIKNVAYTIYIFQYSATSACTSPIDYNIYISKPVSPSEVADKQRRLVEVDVNFIEEITVSHARRE